MGEVRGLETVAVSAFLCALAGACAPASVRPGGAGAGDAADRDARPRDGWVADDWRADGDAPPTDAGVTPEALTCDVLVVGDGLGALAALATILDSDTPTVAASTTLCWAPGESHLGAAATLQLPALDGILASTNAAFLHQHFADALGAAAEAQTGAPWDRTSNPGRSAITNQFSALPAHLETGFEALLGSVGGGPGFPWDPEAPPGPHTFPLGARTVTILKDALPIAAELSPAAPPAPARLTALTFAFLAPNADTSADAHSGIGLYACGRARAARRPVRVEAGLFLDATELGDVALLAHQHGGVNVLAPAGAGALDRHEQAITWGLFIDDGAYEAPKVDLAPWLTAIRATLTGGFNISLEHGEHPWMLPRGADAGFSWFRYRQLAVPGQRSGTGAALTARVTILNQPAIDHTARGAVGTSLLYRADGTYRDPLDPDDAQAVCATLADARTRALAVLRYGSGDGHADALTSPLRARPSPAHAMRDDGLARQPYIREARRILGVRLPGATGAHTITRAEVIGLTAAAVPDTGTPLPSFHTWDSFGYAHYGLLDLHADTRGPYCEPGAACPDERRIHGDFGFANPPVASLPLRALVPRELGGYVAAGKSLSVDTWANGIFRLHNAEWSVGAAAGALAEYFLRHRADPSRDPHRIATCIAGRGTPAVAAGCSLAGTTYCHVVRNIQNQILVPTGARLEIRANAGPEVPDSPASTVCP